MTEELTPKELAKIKKQARAARIRKIRHRVAIGAATLTAVFSGVILARTQLDQPAGDANQIAMVRPVSDEGEPEESGAAEMILVGAVGAANALVSDDDEHHEGDDDHGEGDEHEDEDSDDEHRGIAETVVTAAAGAAGAVLGNSTSDQSTSTTSSEPAPLTTSQS